jgi:hypothetical protein
VKESARWLPPSRSVVPSVSEDAVSKHPVGNGARKEPAPRGVGLGSPHPEARSAEVQPILGRAGLLAVPHTAAKVVQRETAPRPVARPSPWYFTAGERNNFNSRPARLALTRASRNRAVSLSRPVAHRRSDARRRQDGRSAARASPKHSPTPIPPVNRSRFKLDQATCSISISHRKDRQPLQSGQRTAVKQRPHQETGRHQEVTSEPVVLHHGRQTVQRRLRRGAAVCLQRLVGRRSLHDAGR